MFIELDCYMHVYMNFYITKKLISIALAIYLLPNMN
jgi:hypothetical protein